VRFKGRARVGEFAAVLIEHSGEHDLHGRAQ